MSYFQNSVYICPRNRKLNSPLALKFKVMIATTKLIESYKIIERGLQAEIEIATKAIGENNLLLVDAPEYLKSKIEKRLDDLRLKRSIRQGKLNIVVSIIQDLEGLNLHLDKEAKQKEINSKTGLITLSLQECNFIAEEITKNQRSESSLSSFATFETIYDPNYKSLRLDYTKPGDQPSSYPECYGVNIHLNNE